MRLIGTLEAIAEGIEPTRIPVTLRARAGEPTRIEFTPAHEEPAPGTPKLAPSRVPGAPPPPLYLQDVPRAHWFRALDERTLYVQFKPGGRRARADAGIAERLGIAIAEQGPARLVLDVRHNNGGDATLLPPQARTLRDFERGRAGAELVVLMGRNTYSAAQIFLARVDRDTNAFFAGEPSSSRPNFVGEENEVRLPWSGGSGGISNRYHETIAGDTREFIAPDLPLELSSADYFANRDPLLELESGARPHQRPGARPGARVFFVQDGAGAAARLLVVPCDGSAAPLELATGVDDDGAPVVDPWARAWPSPDSPVPARTSSASRSTAAAARCSSTGRPPATRAPPVASR